MIRKEAMTIIVFIVGFTFILIGALMLFSEMAIRKESDRIIGEVVGFTSKLVTHKNVTTTSYQSVVRFRRLDGQNYYAVSSTGSSSPLNQIGDSLRVYVRKSDMSFAAVESNLTFMVGGFMGVIGIILVAIFTQTYKADIFSLGITVAVLLIIANFIRKAIRKNPLTMHQWMQLKAKSKTNKAFSEAEKDQIAWVSEEQIETALKKMRTTAKFVIPIFLLIGVISLGYGFKHYKDKKSFIEIASHAEGTIVELVQSSGSKRSSVIPLVEFLPTNSTEILKFKDSLSVSRTAYQVGDKADVIYDPTNPGHAEIYTGLRNYFLSLILAGTGVMFLYIAWYTNKSVQRTKLRRRCSSQAPRL
jgi:hypothetical protein